MCWIICLWFLSSSRHIFEIWSMCVAFCCVCYTWEKAVFKGQHVCIKFCVQLTQIATGTFMSLNRQSSQWKNPSLYWQNVRQVCSIMKCVLMIFLTCGIVHHEFVPQKHTANKHIYADILWQVWEVVWKQWA